MNGLIEIHGRLARSDRRPANPGRYDLLFSLHPAEEGDGRVWSELAPGVAVAPGGLYHHLLGRHVPLPADLFENGPLWLSVRVVRDRVPEPEHTPRAPLTGAVLLLRSGLARLERALEALSARVGGGNGVPEAVARRIARVAEQVRALEERVARVESSDLAEVLGARIEAFEARIERIDGEDGRLQRIEDELEDLVGPDGDVVDLVERMERIEGRAPELFDALRRRVEGMPAPADFARELRRIERQLGELAGRIEALEQVEPPPPPTAEELGAVRRSGDVMTGGLTINRGGLEVLSGGIKCRGANVTTLEAAHLVRAPKLIADAIELRGDLTVDSTHRAVQCRMIEGRGGSSRRDGLLLLNSRGGAEVVVGNEAAARGMRVHGRVRARAQVAEGSAVAVTFRCGARVEPGDVVCATQAGERVVLCRADADPTVVGVVVDAPGVVLRGEGGSGTAAVAVAGIARCRVEAESGPVRPGALLVTSRIPGHARAAPDDAPPGAVVGKALAGLDGGRAELPVLLAVR